MAAPGIGMSLLLIAVGAILAIAIDAQVSGVDIKAIGGILLAVGCLGLLVSILFMVGVIGAHADETHHIEHV